MDILRVVLTTSCGCHYLSYTQITAQIAAYVAVAFEKRSGASSENTAGIRFAFNASVPGSVWYKTGFELALAKISG